MPAQNLPSHAPDSARTGYFLAIASAASAGAATVVGKWNLEFISPLLMNSLIFSVAGVVLGATILPARGCRVVFVHSRKAWIWIALFSLSSWLAIWAFWAGVQKMDPSLAAFLNRSEVFVAIILAIIFLRERFTRQEALGAALSIAGIIVMKLTLRFEYSTGFWLVLTGALFFGVTEYMSKNAVRYVEPAVLAFLRNSFLAISYWLTLWISGIHFDGLGHVWPGVIALGLLGPIFSRMVYLMALKRVELSKVAIISQSQPVFVLLIALLAFGKLPTLREFTGGILLTLGCLVMIAARMGSLRRSRPAATPSGTR